MASKPKISPNDLGLKVLAAPKEAEETEIDIVAVHGIGATPTRTWTCAKKDDQGQELPEYVNWLLDDGMLPAVVPHARIMTFNYNSLWFGDEPVRTTLSDIANSLLQDLDAEREDCRDRAIILIGHCFGGLVMSKAYTLSKMNPHDFPHIYESITGMLFLGTPFFGSRGLNTQGRIFEMIVEEHRNKQVNIMQTLNYDNDVLVSTVQDFNRDLTNRESAAPGLFCFFEQKATVIGRIIKKDTEPEFVVDSTSGVLSGFQSRGLPLDHFQMNKFESKDDSNYKAVCYRIRKMIEKSKEILEARKPRGKPASSASSNQSRPSSTLPFKRESHFASRDGLLGVLNQKHGQNVKVALCGASGSGKTHVAIEYAHNFHSEYPESRVLWVNASSAEEFELSYKLIAQSLHLRWDAETSVLEAVRHYLKQDSSGYWILVVDGVEDDEKLKATCLPEAGGSLLDFVPAGLHGRVLFTTRSLSLASRLADQQYVVEMPNLNDDDVMLLWSGKITKDAAKRQSAVEIANAVGRSPTSLSMANFYREALGHVNAKKYLKLIQNLNLPTTTAADNPNTGIYQAWRLLYDDLEGKSPDVAKLMLLIGALDVQSLRCSFLVNATESRSQLDKQLEQLTEYGMVEPANNRITIGVTASIRRCVRLWLVQKERLGWAEEWATSLMYKYYPNPEAKEWETCELVDPCVLAVLKFQPTATSGKSERATLLYRVGCYQSHRCQQAVAIEYFKDCLQWLEKDPSKHSDVISKAQKALEKARQNHSKKANNDPQQDPQGKAGEDLGARSLWTSAKKDDMLRKLKERKAQDWKKDDVNDASTIAGDLFKMKRAESDESVELYKQVAKWCSKNYGSSDIDTMRQKYNLGLALDAKGQYEEAAKIYLESCKSAERSLGPGHPELLRIMGSIARMHCATGQIDEATETTRTVLEGQKKTLGIDHPQTLVTRQNAAMLAHEYGHLEEAEEELVRVLDKQSQLFGPDDKACLSTMCSLALNHRLQGKLKEAEKLFEMALDRQTQTLGKGHPDVATTRLMLDELRNEIRGKSQKLQNVL